MNRRVLLLLFSLLVVHGSVRGDSVTLSDGTEIKGEILDQGPDSVLIEFNVTPTIKDQKTIPRNRIQKIFCIAPDEKAYMALGNVSSPPTILDTAHHDLMIDKKIPEFLNEYPYSQHLSELRKELQVLEDERVRLRQGDRRINGVWITAAQIDANPYEFGAKINFVRTTDLAQRNATVEALKSYESLEKNYPGSEVMPDAIDVALQQLGVLQDKLNEAKANFVVIDKRRQGEIACAPADQAKEMKDALENERLVAKTMMAEASQNGAKFFPIFQNIKDALDALQVLITSENQRLLLFQRTSMREGIAATRECARCIAAGDLKHAEEQLSAAQKLWPADAEIPKFQREIDTLTKEQAAAALASKKAAELSPSPKPKP